MQLTFLGTGSAMQHPERAQTGLLLERDDRTLLVDCGSGVLKNLAGTEAGYEHASTVLLTHHHLDHVADLLSLLKTRWLAGEAHLEVVGPPGTKSLVDDLLEVFDYLRDRCDLSIREVAPDAAFEVAAFDVESYGTRHSKPCNAYRFANDDGDVVFSGDTEAFAGLANFADGARILVHDCSFPDDVDVSGHPTPTQLGEALAGADVERLYLTHLYPHTKDREDEMVESVEKAGFDGDVRVASDGLRFEI